VDWYIYIVSNNAHTLYAGMTNDLVQRIEQHKNRTYENAFTARYTFDRCVYFELLSSKHAAARREQRIKRWSRAKKVALIQKLNPNWLDLSSSWSDSLCLR
jgi:putative endonuclease